MFGGGLRLLFTSQAHLINGAVITTTLHPSKFYQPQHTAPRAGYSAPSTTSSPSPPYSSPTASLILLQPPHTPAPFFSTPPHPLQHIRAPHLSLCFEQSHHGDQQSRTNTKRPPPTGARARYRKSRSRQTNDRRGVPPPEPPSRVAKDHPRIRAYLSAELLRGVVLANRSTAYHK